MECLLTKTSFRGSLTLSAIKPNRKTAYIIPYIRPYIQGYRYVSMHAMSIRLLKYPQTIFRKPRST